jgi:hypothetical protein
MSPSELWRFLLIGYPFTILIETPILLIGLSSRHALKRRLFAGVWLTACTYPIVVLVMPLIFLNSSRTVYLAVAETFAPVAECILFWCAYGKSDELGKRSMWQDFATIVVANLASFIAGEIMAACGWFGFFS